MNVDSAEKGDISDVNANDIGNVYKNDDSGKDTIENKNNLSSTFDKRTALKSSSR